MGRRTTMSSSPLAKDLWWGDTADPRSFAFPKNLLWITIGFEILLWSYAVALVLQSNVGVLHVKEPVRDIFVRNCYLDIRSETNSCPSQFEFQSFNARIREPSEDELVIDGTTSLRCQITLCLEARNDTLQFWTARSVLNLENLISVDHPVNISTWDLFPFTSTKVLIDNLTAPEMNVNLTQGIVQLDRMNTTNVNVQVVHGPVYVQSDFTTPWTVNALIQEGGYCITPNVSSWSTGSCANSDGTECAFTADSTDTSGGSWHSNIFINASSIYIHDFADRVSETSFEINSTRIAGPLMGEVPTVSPILTDLLNTTEIWAAQSTIDDYVQAIEIVTPGLGTLYLNGKKKITMEIGPEWLAFLSAYALRVHYRRLSSTLNHYRCRETYGFIEDRPASLINLQQGPDFPYDEFTNADFGNFIKAHFQLEDQYEVGKALHDLATPEDLVKSITAFTSPEFEYTKIDDLLGNRWVFYYFARLGDGELVLLPLKMGRQAWALIFLSTMSAFFATLTIYVLLFTQRYKILNSFMLQDSRMLLRNAVNYKDNCPYHYFFSVLTMTSWLTFRVGLYMVQNSQYPGRQNPFSRFLMYYYKPAVKRGEKIKEGEQQDDGEKKLTRQALEQIVTKYERWCLLRYRSNEVSADDMGEHLDKFGARRYTDTKLVMTGLRPKRGIRDTKFTLQYASLGSFYDITKNSRDEALFDDLLNRCLANGIDLDEDGLVKKLTQWKIKVVKKPFEIAGNVIARSLEALSEESLYPLVKEWEANASSFPSLAIVEYRTTGKERGKRRKFIFFCWWIFESVGNFVSVFAPFVASYVFTLPLEIEHSRYSTSTSILLASEVAVAATDTTAPRPQNLLSTTIFAATLFYTVCMMVEPLLVALSFRWFTHWTKNEFYNPKVWALLLRWLLTGISYFMLLCITTYMVVFCFNVLVWWILGAIIAPNRMLVYCSSVLTFFYIMYQSYTMLTSMRKGALSRLKEQILNHILKMVRKTPAADMFNQAENAATNAAASASAAPGITSGLVLDAISDDKQTRELAVSTLSSSLQTPQAVINLGLALVKREPKFTGDAVESVLKELKVPENFAPLATQLVFQILSLPSSAAELSHALYKLSPEYEAKLLEYDEILVPLIQAAMTKRFTDKVLVDAISRITLDELAELLNLQPLFLRRAFQGGWNMYKQQETKAMEDLAFCMELLVHRVPTEPPQVLPLWKVVTECLKMLSGQDHVFVATTLDFLRKCGLRETPIMHTLMPLLQVNEETLRSIVSERTAVDYRQIRRQAFELAKGTPEHLVPSRLASNVAGLKQLANDTENPLEAGARAVNEFDVDDAERLVTENLEEHEDEIEGAVQQAADRAAEEAQSRAESEFSDLKSKAQDKLLEGRSKAEALMMKAGIDVAQKLIHVAILRYSMTQEQITKLKRLFRVLLLDDQAIKAAIPVEMQENASISMIFKKAFDWYDKVRAVTNAKTKLQKYERTIGFLRNHLDVLGSQGKKIENSRRLSTADHELLTGGKSGKIPTSVEATLSEIKKLEYQMEQKQLSKKLKSARDDVDKLLAGALTNPLMLVEAWLADQWLAIDDLFRLQPSVSPPICDVELLATSIGVPVPGLNLLREGIQGVMTLIRFAFPQVDDYADKARHWIKEGEDKFNEMVKTMEKGHKDLKVKIDGELDAAEQEMLDMVDEAETGANALAEDLEDEAEGALGEAAAGKIPKGKAGVMAADLSSGATMYIQDIFAMLQELSNAVLSEVDFAHAKKDLKISPFLIENLRKYSMSSVVNQFVGEEGLDGLTENWKTSMQSRREKLHKAFKNKVGKAEKIAEEQRQKLADALSGAKTLLDIGENIRDLLAEYKDKTPNKGQILRLVKNMMLEAHGSKDLPLLDWKEIPFLNEASDPIQALDDLFDLYSGTAFDFSGAARVFDMDEKVLLAVRDPVTLISKVREVDLLPIIVSLLRGDKIQELYTDSQVTQLLALLGVPQSDIRMAKGYLQFFTKENSKLDENVQLAAMRMAASVLKSRGAEIDQNELLAMNAALRNAESVESRAKLMQVLGLDVPEKWVDEPFDEDGYREMADEWQYLDEGDLEMMKDWFLEQAKTRSEGQFQTLLSMLHKKLASADLNKRKISNVFSAHGDAFRDANKNLLVDNILGISMDNMPPLVMELMTMAPTKAYLAQVTKNTKLEQAEGVFRKFDTDNDGKIDEKEFRAICEKLKIADDSEEEFRNLMATFDVNKNGKIDFDEFQAIISDHMQVKITRVVNQATDSAAEGTARVQLKIDDILKEVENQVALLNDPVQYIRWVNESQAVAQFKKDYGVSVREALAMYQTFRDMPLSFREVTELTMFFPSFYDYLKKITEQLEDMDESEKGFAAEKADEFAAVCKFSMPLFFRRLERLVEVLHDIDRKVKKAPNMSVNIEKIPGLHHPQLDAAWAFAKAFNSCHPTIKAFNDWWDPEDDYLDMYDAFDELTPFRLLDTAESKVPQNVRYIFGVLSGNPAWFPPHLPVKFCALVCAAIHRKNTPQSVLEIISGCFPMRYRKLSVEVMQLMSGRPDGTLIAISEFVGVSPALLRNARDLLLPTGPEGLIEALITKERVSLQGELKDTALNSKYVEAAEHMALKTLGVDPNTGIPTLHQYRWIIGLKEALNGNPLALLMMEEWKLDRFRKEKAFIKLEELMAQMMMAVLPNWESREYFTKIYDNLGLDDDDDYGDYDEEDYEDMMENIGEVEKFTKKNFPVFAKKLKDFIGVDDDDDEFEDDMTKQLNVIKRVVSKLVNLAFGCLSVSRSDFDSAANYFERFAGNDQDVALVARIGLIAARLVMEEGAVSDPSAIFKTLLSVLKAAPKLLAQSVGGGVGDAAENFKKLKEKYPKVALLLASVEDKIEIPTYLPDGTLSVKQIDGCVANLMEERLQEILDNFVQEQAATVAGAGVKALGIDDEDDFYEVVEGAEEVMATIVKTISKFIIRVKDSLKGINNGLLMLRQKRDEVTGELRPMTAGTAGRVRLAMSTTAGGGNEGDGNGDGSAAASIAPCALDNDMLQQVKGKFNQGTAEYTDDLINRLEAIQMSRTESLAELERILKSLVGDEVEKKKKEVEQKAARAAGKLQADSTVGRIQSFAMGNGDLDNLIALSKGGTSEGLIARQEELKKAIESLLTGLYNKPKEIAEKVKSAENAAVEEGKAHARKGLLYALDEFADFKELKKAQGILKDFENKYYDNTFQENLWELRDSLEDVESTEAYQALVKNENRSDEKEKFDAALHEARRGVEVALEVLEDDDFDEALEAIFSVVENYKKADPDRFRLQGEAMVSDLQSIRTVDGADVKSAIKKDFNKDAFEKLINGVEGGAAGLDTYCVKIVESYQKYTAYCDVLKTLDPENYTSSEEFSQAAIVRQNIDILRTLRKSMGFLLIIRDELPTLQFFQSHVKTLKECKRDIEEVSDLLREQPVVALKKGVSVLLTVIAPDDKKPIVPYAIELVNAFIDAGNDVAHTPSLDRVLGSALVIFDNIIKIHQAMNPDDTERIQELTTIHDLAYRLKTVADKVLQKTKEDPNSNGADLFITLLNELVAPKKAAIQAKVENDAKGALAQIGQGAKLPMTGQDHKKLSLLLEVVQGNWDALPELVASTGISIPEARIAQLLTVLKLMQSLRKIAKTKDLSKISVTDTIDIITTQIFNEFDIQKKGMITYDQYLTALQRMKLNLSPQEAKLLFSKVDVDESGYIDLDEFKGIIEDVQNRFQKLLIDQLNLSREAIYISLIFTGLSIFFLLAFIVLGVYAFSDGSQFTAVVTGVLPMSGGALSSITDPNSLRFLLEKCDELVTIFFEKLNEITH